MSSEETSEAGVRGRIGPGKSSAGIDMSRGPKSHSDDEEEKGEVRMSHGVHMMTTKAQVHASNEVPDSIQMPMSNGVHTMATRSKFRTSTNDMDSRPIPPRHSEIYKTFNYF